MCVHWRVKSLKNDCRLILLNFSTSYLFDFPPVMIYTYIRINTNSAYNIRMYISICTYVYIRIYVHLYTEA